MTYKPKYLGKGPSEYSGLDPIPTSHPPVRVSMHSDEVTAICPMTSAPDMYQVTINYTPDKFICESKSLKLYFFSLRDKGIFAESLAVEVAEEFTKYIQPHNVQVIIEQKSRGGVTIIATHEIPVESSLPPIFGTMLRIASGHPPNEIEAKKEQN